MMPFAALAPASVLAGSMDQDTQTTKIDNALPVAGLFVVILLIAVYFLWRSMRKQMKRIDPTLPPGTDDRRQQADREYTAEAIRRGQELRAQGTDDAASQ